MDKKRTNFFRDQTTYKLATGQVKNKLNRCNLYVLKLYLGCIRVQSYLKISSVKSIFMLHLALFTLKVC